MSYPYDRDHLARTAALLWAHVPEFHRRGDAGAPPRSEALGAARLPWPEPPDEASDLRALIEALAAPLAALRQSIEELHADLFVDSAGDDMLGALAASIALDPAFRDPEANRRDLRAAMARRRRKGAPSMLAEMARALIDRPVATREGWKAVMIAQDLDILRRERVAADLRPASVAARAEGPLATLARSLDPRPISARGGHADPRSLVHWAFLTRLHPLLRAACRRLPDGAADLRFAFDAANAWGPLGVRSTGVDDQPGTDRAPEGLFAEDPGAWHGREGRFTVRFAGLPAAASPEGRPAPRAARTIRADAALARLPASIGLIELDGARTTGRVEIALMAAPLAGDQPDMAAAVARAAITVSGAGLAATTAGAGAAPADAALLLRLRPEPPAPTRLLGSATLAIATGAPAGLRAATEAGLAQSGWRRGAVYVRIPEMRLDGERWFFVGADGSLHDAAPPGGGPGLRPLAGGAIPGRALVAEPVGPVWPPAPETAERTPFSPALAAPAAAPVPLHGLTALRETGASLLPAGERCALALALTFFAAGRRFEPMLRLVWDGPDPRTAAWEALDPAARPLAAADAPSRFAALGAVLAQGRADLALALRFESERQGAILAPGELAFTACDGRATLVHLPELVAADAADALWPLGPAPLGFRSAAAQVGADGSTWVAGSNILMRRSLGPEAPLAGPVAMRRRVVRWRRLCAWRNEAGPSVLAPTPEGRLDLDPRFGLFAVAAAEPPPAHPPGPAAPPPAVTVDMEAGATMEIGALPMDRDRLLNRAPRAPTRLVSASGHLGLAMTPALLALPLHRSLAEALAAATGAEETIRIVDSGFYPAEALAWPAQPARLAIEAAAGERPMVAVAGSAPGAAAYDRLELTGVALLPAAGPLTMALPPAQEVEIAFLSTLAAGLTLALALREAAGAERALVRRSALGPVALAQPGELRIEDSIVDAGGEGAAALAAPLARLVAERITVIGTVAVGLAEVSDAILAGAVTASERFRGCIRFSLLAPGGATPRKHRVVTTDPATGQPVRAPFLTLDRRDPAYLRLDPEGDRRVLAGASDGGEMGALNAARLGELLAGLARRLAEHTPAGLRTGVAPPR